MAVKIRLVERSSEAVSKRASSLASVVDVVTVDRFEAFHLIAPPNRQKICLCDE